MRIIIVHNYYQQSGGEDTVFSALSASLLQNHGHDMVEYIDDNQKVRQAE